MFIHKRWRKQLTKTIAGILLAMILVPQTVFAIEPLEVGADVTLKLNYQENTGTAISGAKFRLYKVGEISRFGEVEPIGTFAEYPLSFENLDAYGWKTLAETLAIYVEKDKIATVDRGETDEAGQLVFPNEAKEMKTGLYLMIGENYTFANHVYTIEPTLLCLPNRDENEDWIYDVEVNPKYSLAAELTEIQAIKQWKDDDNNAKKRPKEIEVSLLKEGKEIETVTLSKDNDWRYTWRGLDASYEWAVVEKEVINGYTVYIERDEGTFLLTNTYHTPERPPGGNIPQTGVLWWPVPILAGIGMLLFMTGWVRRRKSEN